MILYFEAYLGRILTPVRQQTVIVRAFFGGGCGGEGLVSLNKQARARDGGGAGKRCAIFSKTGTVVGGNRPAVQEVRIKKGCVALFARFVGGAGRRVARCGHAQAVSSLFKTLTRDT